MSARRKSEALRDRKRTLLLRKYKNDIAHTDFLPKNDIRPVLMGLVGEVGSVLAAGKKLDREGKVFSGYRATIQEELGDTLWYFVRLCERLDVQVDTVFSEAAKAGGARVSTRATRPPHAALLALGRALSDVLTIRSKRVDSFPVLCAFAHQYLRVVRASRLQLAKIVEQNAKKTSGRFLTANFNELPRFDDDFPLEERLPVRFKIVITQRESGQSYLQYSGVFVGDPLTDNIADQDGYRFHDVFHFAYAAVLNWSPVFRALLKQKRKSNKRYDEEQDGGRAVVVEEGLTAWIFSRAKKLDFFADQRSLSFDMLKTVEQFVQGYEVDQCPLSLWERAILQGYQVFRKVHKNNGGIVYGDLTTRSIKYRPIRLRG
jgi:NTP pyrophosphatase (non-canonical NTP hydrolase)